MELQKTTKKRFLAMLLSVAMVFTMLPTAAFAAEATTGCTHVHDESCGYAEAVAEVPCDKGCTDTDGDGAVDHAPDCAYTPAIEGSPCTHVHDEACGGLTDSGSAAPTDTPEKPVCTCESKCTEGEVNADCPVCAANYADCAFEEAADQQPAEDVSPMMLAGTGDTTPNYLCFTAEEGNSSVTLNYASGSNVQYSTDGGANWIACNAAQTETSITLAEINDTVCFKGTDVATDDSSHFSMTGKIAASGSVTSLTDGTGGDSNVTLTESCYYSMFSGCTSLTTPPALPATTLAESCYTEMFKKCTSLTQAPALPATTLAEHCYFEMFSNSGLTTAPALPATELAAYCYNSMFSGCANLTTTPALPATTMAEYCYYEMFSNSGLTTAPALPATKLAEYCYSSMFSVCTNLTSPPALPATALTEGCYSGMFVNSGLTTAPTLPATALATRCYQSMFAGCADLNAAPALPATTLAELCYYSMFANCTNLTAAPALPAAELAASCYSSMFSACTNLTAAPALPATELASYCYSRMFYYCTKLTTPPALPATTLAEGCYSSMFTNCALKVSAEKTNEYGIAWRIPTSGNASEATGWNDSMLANTGGTFTGNPTINTTYYLYGTTPALSFDARNGVSIANVEISGSMTLPTNPTWGDNEGKNNYTFEGWYTGIDGAGDLIITKVGTFVEGKKPTASTTLYAKWTNEADKTVRTEMLNLMSYNATYQPTGINPDHTQGATYDSTTNIYRHTEQGWSWDATKEILTLANLTLHSADATQLKFPGGTITLPTGTVSTLIGTGISEKSRYGIEGLNETILFDGIGTLNVTSGDSSKDDSVAINAKASVTCDGATIHLLSGKTTNQDYASSGMRVSGDVNMKSGVFTIATSDSPYCYGINASTLHMSGGQLSITTGNASKGCNYGIYADINCIAGEINTSTGTSPTESFGVDGSVTMTGGQLTATGNTATASYGIHDGNMDISGNLLTASGKTAAISMESMNIHTGTVAGAQETYVANETKTLTQAGTAPVVISFGPSISVGTQSDTLTYGTEGSATFNVTASNFTPTFDNSSIEWVTDIHDGIIPSFSGNTLTMTTTTAANAGEYKFKVVSGETKSSEVTLTITKATPAAPTAPTVQSKTDTTVTLDTVAGQQYAIRIGTDSSSELVWQDSGVFENLTAKTAYNVYTRIKEDDNHTASAASTATSVTTKAAAATAPAAPTVKTGADAPTANRITIATVHGLEYVISTSATAPADWSNAVSGDGGDHSFTGLTAETQYYIYVREPGTEAVMPSASANTAQYTAAAAPADGEGYTENYTTETITPASGYEVRKKTTPEGTYTAIALPLEPGEKYEIRKAASGSVPASEPTEFTIAARPAAPTTLTKTDETVKDKGDGKVSGVTSAMEFSTDSGSTWTTGNGTDIALAVGDTIKVRVKATATAPHGEEMSFTGAASNVTLTVTFNSNGGSAVSGISDLSYRAAITAPTQPTNGTKNFGGWYKDTALTQAWSFTADKVTGNITLYAKWSEAAVYTIGGKVTEATDSAPTNVEGATVTLKKGDTVLATTTSDANGDYSFSGIVAGEYNLVATKGNQTSTILVTITTSSQTANIELPKGDLNYEVESAIGVVAGGLGDVANDTSIVPAPKKEGKVEVKLVVESTSASNADAAEVDAIKEQAGKQQLAYLDINIKHYINNAEQPNITNTNSRILEIVIPFETAGKEDITVYRYHDSSSAAFEKLTARPTNGYQDSKYFVGDGFIVIYTSKFSTYAIGYVAPKTITFDANGGSVTTTSAKTNAENKLDTLPTPTKSGSYRFDGWYTSAGGGTEVTTSTVFTNDSTIYAHWTYTGGGSSGSGGGSSYTTYTITATASAGGSISTGKYVSVREGDSAGFTMTPDKGYAIADVLVDGKSVGAVANYVFTNVRSNHTIAVTFKVSSGHVNPQTGVDFEDVSENDWFYEDVYQAVENGWFAGTSSTTFSPNLGTTRGMIVTVLWRMENQPKAENAMTFTDVAKNSYCYDAVAWGAEQGIIKGYDALTYKPNQVISRQELAAILYRYTQFKGKDVSVGEDTNILSYTDVASVGEWAIPSMQWACGAGLMSGSDNKLMPLDQATRAQFAAVLVRLNELLVK